MRQSTTKGSIERLAPAGAAVALCLLVAAANAAAP